MDQPAASDLVVVTPVLSLNEPRMNIGMMIDAAATDDPHRVALVIGQKVSIECGAHSQ